MCTNWKAEMAASEEFSREIKPEVQAGRGRKSKNMFKHLLSRTDQESQGEYRSQGTCVTEIILYISAGRNSSQHCVAKHMNPAWFGMYDIMCVPPRSLSQAQKLVFEVFPKKIKELTAKLQVGPDKPRLISIYSKLFLLYPLSPLLPPPPFCGSGGYV